MAKKMLIDSTHPEETRVVVVNGNKVEEFDFDSTARSLITGNIYLAKVSRIEPSLQAAFVDYGGNRQGFLAFSEIHPDYYQIPQADREALMQEELERQAEEAEEEEAEDDKVAEEPKRGKSRSRRRSSRKKNVAESTQDEAVITGEVEDADEVAADDAQVDEAENASDEGEDAAVEKAAKPKSRPRRRSKAAKEADAENEAENAADDAADDAVQASGDDALAVIEPEDTPAVPEEVEPENPDVEEEIRPQRSKKRSARPYNRYRIQEVIKPRQILLVQVIKEERGNKGAALTTYISLPGRYCVLMPNTARGGGISRKISNINDRKRLRTLAKGFNVPQGAGLIVRTAGAKKTAEDIERDYAFLTRQWNQIRELTLSSTAPAAVYEESGPIKRAIRDLLTTDTDEILIEGERGYAEAREYVDVLMPDRVKSVKLYDEKMPLFSRYQVENYLSSMFNPVVQLKSGGYLVIGVTEALVAIDVNSGRSTKEASIEDTALKTNMEAAEEVARQLKLRDLAGLIVIDFIDMEQYRHQQEVENKLKDCLRKDRARIQVGRISSFGLLEMSRQRLRTGLVEAITAPCPHCHGTGITRSDDSTALAVIRAIEEEIARGRANELNVTVSPAIANYLFNEKREYIFGFLDQYGVLVRITADVSLNNSEYNIEKIKNPARKMPKAEPVSAASIIEQSQNGDSAETNGASADGNGSPNKRRRRRGGRGRKKDNAQNENTQGEAVDAQNANADASQSDDQGKESKPKRGRKKSDEAPETKDAVTADAPEASDADTADAKAEKPKRKRRTKAEIEAKKVADHAPESVDAKADAKSDGEKAVSEKPKSRRGKKAAKPADADAETAVEEKPKKAKSTKKSASKSAKDDAAKDAPAKDAAPDTAPESTADEKAEKPKRKRRTKAEIEAEKSAKSEAEVSVEPVVADKKPAKKRTGWWSS